MSEQLHVPASSGGLVRYFDEYKSKIQVKPEMVIVMIVIVIAFVFALKFIFKL
jgi:preprotein translocase subunit Sec61beta